MNMKAKDPVCGCTIEPLDGTLHLQHQGQEYYFCSLACLRSFKQAPASFRVAES